MSVFKVASRYAKSLIDLSKEQNTLEEVKGDIEQIVRLFKSNSELQAVMSNPIIGLDKKHNVLNALFEDRISPLILVFFNLMVRKGRGKLILPTAEEFIRAYNVEKGIVHARVTSASSLSDSSLSELKEILEKETSAQVILTNIVDSALIGGFVVHVGDRQIDTSVAGKLNRLERHFEVQGV